MLEAEVITEVLEIVELGAFVSDCAFVELTLGDSVLVTNTVLSLLETIVEI